MSSFRMNITMMFAIICGLLSYQNSQAQCPIVIDSITTVNPSCNGSFDGSITVHITGGFPQYVYTLIAIPNPPIQIFTNDTFATFTGLGDYNFIVAVEIVDIHLDSASDNALIVFLTMLNTST